TPPTLRSRPGHGPNLARAAAPAVTVGHRQRVAIATMATRRCRLAVSSVSARCAVWTSFVRPSKEVPMPSTPDVSVVIPTRDRPDLLVRAVRSALGQTVENIEVIVVIDGPDPSSREALA